MSDKSYSRGEKFSRYALLIAGIIIWGSLISYKVQATASNMAFMIGAILFVIGIALSAKAILNK